MAEGTVRQAAERSRLPEFPSQTFAGLSVVEALAVRYADLGKSTREAIDAAETFGDAATADLFTAASRELDQALYFLEAHLQG